MATRKQVEANRRNSKNSSGPRTQQGKKESSMNALSHGLRAKTLILATENEEDYLQMRSELLKELSPAGRLESEMADRIVELIWAGRRFAEVEAGLLNSTMAETQAQEVALHQASSDALGLAGSLNGFDPYRLRSPGPLLARGLVAGGMLEKWFLLGRYRLTHQRTLMRHIEDYGKLQADRRVIDADVP